ncbi:hypothetical protein DMJ13_06995 [halophilic archaeon]|nr:hypothetical protein DMJ13_06995 [halophilic archaeon]
MQRSARGCARRVRRRATPRLRDERSRVVGDSWVCHAGGPRRPHRRPGRALLYTGLSAVRHPLRPPIGPPVSADSVHIRQLLENLFENAVEHGGADVTVRIGDLEDADGFYVEDDGPGIPDADREAVLEAGYTTASNGIGLGPTFASQLAAAYAWDCTVTGSASGGARFEFRNVECADASRRSLTLRLRTERRPESDTFDVCS